MHPVDTPATVVDLLTRRLVVDHVRTQLPYALIAAAAAILAYAVVGAAM